MAVKVLLLGSEELKLKYCRTCNFYTLKDICTKCNNKTINPSPPKFSPHDTYGRYRRELKKEYMFGGKKDG